jgi:hypothetical protein
MKKIILFLLCFVLTSTVFAGRYKGKITHKWGPGGSIVSVCCQGNGACSKTVSGENGYTPDLQGSVAAFDEGRGCSFDALVRDALNRKRTGESKQKVLKSQFRED